MTTFLVRRLIWGVLTMFFIASLCFFITRLAPGSPFSNERQLTEEAMANIEAFYGLDKPILVQYLNTMWAYINLDFGPSYYNRDHSVSQLIWPALRVSAMLGSIAFVIALVLGLPLGIFASSRQNEWPDHAAMTVSVAGICIPNFLLGPLLVMLFTFALGWLPAALWPKDASLAELSRLIMPAITLALVHVAYVSRLARAGMLDVLNKDYIRTARAKGVSERWVVFKHGLKNGVTPVLSYAGPMAAMIITGSLVVEKIFQIPGLGQHFVKGALNRDHPLLMGSIIVFSGLIIVFNLIVDWAYSLLDPRVRST